MNILKYSLPGRIHFGIDNIKEMASLVKSKGKRVFFITDPELRGSPRFRSLLFQLQEKDVNTVVYDNLSVLITLDGLNEAAKLAKAGQVDIIGAYGGTSATLAAKAVALSVKSGTAKGIINSDGTGDSLPVYSFTTSMRNYSVFQPHGYIINKKSMRPMFFNLATVPVEFAFFDGSFTDTLSVKSQSTIALDIILASIEGLLEPDNSYILKTLFSKALVYAFTALSDHTRKKHEQGNENQWKAGILVSMTTDSCRRGIGSALSEAFRLSRQIPRSWSSGVLLPHIIDENLGKDPDLFRRIVHEIDEDLFHLTTSEAVLYLGSLIRRRIAQLELPSRLSDLGITNIQLREGAELAVALAAPEKVFKTKWGIKETITLAEKAL
ncbi:MAG: iron-containing alcohol dehydrogenase [Spirochaetia bacterium]